MMMMLRKCLFFEISCFFLSMSIYDDFLIHVNILNSILFTVLQWNINELFDIEREREKKKLISVVQFKKIDRFGTIETYIYTHTGCIV